MKSAASPTAPGRPRTSAVVKSGRVVSLTFDDGPDERWTPHVLEQLARCKVEATFFMVGERARAHGDVVRRVLAAGHEIQLHCDRHVRHTELSEAELLLDAGTALATLAHAGAHPRLWRAPWGVCTQASARVARRFGLQLVRWSIDTHDWRGDHPQTMLAHARDRLVPGAVVLMHDAPGPGARRRSCENTLRLLPMLAGTARSSGLALAPMRHEPRASVRSAIEMPL